MLDRVAFSAPAIPAQLLASPKTYRPSQSTVVLGVRRALEARTLISALPVGAVDFASPEKVYADSEPNRCPENADYLGVPDIAGRALYQVADTGCEPGRQPGRNRAQIGEQRKRE